jgi:hypothetical protein
VAKWPYGNFAPTAVYAHDLFHRVIRLWRLLRNVYYSLDGSSDMLLGTVSQSGEWTLGASFTTIHIYVNVNPGTVYYEQPYVDGTLVASETLGMKDYLTQFLFQAKYPD